MSSWKGRIPGALDAVGLDSLKNRILALAVIATLVPALSTAVLSYRQNRRALTANLNGELASRGSQTAREVDLWVKERSYDVRVFTGSFEVTENLVRISQGGAARAAAQKRLADYLAGVQGRFTDYAELQVLDPGARLVASSSDASSSIELPPEWLPRLKNGETVLGEPYRAGSAGTRVTLAAPIFNTDGRFLGVLAATLSFDAVGHTLAALTPGAAGGVDLVSSAGQLIATSGTGGADVEPATLTALARAGGSSAEYVDHAGTPRVGSLTPVPTAEAYAQVAHLRNSALALVSVLLVVVGVVAYLLGSVIVRPLVRLTAAARAVAGGDLSVDLPVTGRGEVGYLTQVFNDMVAKLRQSRQELDQRSRELERLSVTDQLTGLFNRRHLLEALDHEIRRADRQERPFCVIMMDVDHFKEYNDTYGHLAGDQVLKGVGKAIPDVTRGIDVVARYGGEEFIVLLPECDFENGILTAERIRARIAEESFDGRKVTISVGVAAFPAHGETVAATIGAADEALYEAKRLGRDRVQGASPEASAVTRQRETRRAATSRKKRVEGA